MPTILNAYLGFATEARDALTFYHDAFGGELTLNAYRDSGVPHDEADADLILHGMLRTPDGLVLMGADSGSRPENDPGKAALALSGDDAEELSGYYEKLSADGTILEPLERAPWGDWFGMFVDKFGVRWMVNIAGQRD